MICVLSNNNIHANQEKLQQSNLYCLELHDIASMRMQNARCFSKRQAFV